MFPNEDNTKVIEKGWREARKEGTLYPPMQFEKVRMDIGIGKARLFHI